MAAACSVAQETEVAGEVNAELIEAHIVAQAITELQEIQAPATQSSSAGTDDVELSNEITEDGDFQTASGQTHVIYYIEDGTIARTEDRSLVDSAVQANDYDIERRSGKLPARKRVIPVKFRDYKNTSNDEDSDSDYDPHEHMRSRPTKRVRLENDESALSTESNLTDGMRKVGRPRKNFFPTQMQPYHSEDISYEVERMYQAALQLSQNEILGNQTGDTVPVDAGSPPENDETPGEETGQSNADAEGSKENTDGLGTEEDKVREMIKVEPDPTDTEAQSESTGGTHKMKTRGKRVPVYGSDMSQDGGYQELTTGRGRGRPRMAYMPYYKCPECGKTFRQKGNLKTHIRLHIAGKPFHCPEEGCDKCYRSNESLRRHLLTHQGIKPFSCDMCEQDFSSSVALTEHRNRHLNEKPYQCPHCQKCFRQVSCFRRHLFIHTGDLPYSCNICQKRFAQTAYLRSHMKVHTGEKPFQCPVCDKRFAHQSDVKRHSTTHTGEKRYSCSKCQARFSDVSSKNRHEKEHENNKKYTCNLCSDTFKRPGQLRSHLLKKHSHTFAVKIERDPSSGALSFKLDEEAEATPPNISQKRIASLIKVLHSKGIPAEGIVGNLPTDVISQTADIPIASEHVTDISQLEKEVDASVVEGDLGVPVETEGVEIQADDNEQTFIAITDLAETLGMSEKDLGGEMRYKVLYEIDENGEQKQILVPYNPADDEENIHLEYSTESMVPSCISEVTTATETIVETAESIPEFTVQDGGSKDNEIQTVIFAESDLELKETECEVRTKNVADKKPPEFSDGVPVSVASGIDYVNSPDFAKQEYYNWLTGFTEFCKVVPMPLDVSLFQKISQVHKTLSDVMATPCGVVADKDNFRVLMNISKELSTIINEHLVFVLENLNSEEKWVEESIVENE